MKPIRRERLHDTISKHLAIAILRGEADTWTSENDLCRKLEVSRSVLRESIKVLASKGLLEVRPKIGITVRPQSDWNLLDPELLVWQFEARMDDQLLRHLVEVRLIVEPAAAGLAAVRATSEEIALLRDCYRKMEESVDDRDAYNAADLRFHVAVFAACHNPLLERVTATLRTGLAATQKVISKLHADVGLPLHEAVVNAVSQRDPAAARAAAEKLILQAAHEVYDVLHPDNPDGWDAISWSRFDRDPSAELVPS